MRGSCEILDFRTRLRAVPALRRGRQLQMGAARISPSPGPAMVRGCSRDRGWVFSSQMARAGWSASRSGSPAIIWKALCARLTGLTRGGPTASARAGALPLTGLTSKPGRGRSLTGVSPRAALVFTGGVGLHAADFEGVAVLDDPGQFLRRFPVPARRRGELGR